MAIDFGQIGNALGGVGASLQGRGLEFAKQQNDQRRQGIQDAQSAEMFGLKKKQLAGQQERLGIQDERATAEFDFQNRERAEKRAEDRQRTLFTDARAGLIMFKQGNFEGLLKLGESRLSEAKNFKNINFDNTQQVVDLTRVCMTGDKEGCARLEATLQNADDVGVAFKILDKSKPAELVKGSNVIDGQLVTRDPVTGKAIATPIEGLTPDKGKAEDRKLRREELDLKKKTLKLRQLEGKARAAKTEEQRKKLELEAQTLKSEVAFEATNAISTAQGTVDTIGRLLEKGSGLAEAAGISSAFPTIAGSKAANFESTLESLKSQTFLTQVEKMRGLGALTEAEGAKLVSAIGELDLKMSDKALRASIERIRDKLIDAKSRLEKKFGRSSSTDDGGTPSQGGAPNGTIIVNPSTGERMERKNGQWQPI